MIVYKATNLINNKIYIGQTSKNLNKRIIQHLCDSKKRKKNIIFLNAINKYGIDNFKFETSIYCENKYWMNYYEKRLIELYNANNDKFGYNMTLGGEGTPGRKISENRKKELSNKMKGSGNLFYGKTHTIETKNKISKNHHDVSNENNPMYGETHTEETKRKMSMKKQGIFNGKNNPFYGKKHTEKTKEKMKQRKLRRCVT